MCVVASRNGEQVWGREGVKLLWRQTCRGMSFISRALSKPLSLTLLLEQNNTEQLNMRESNQQHDKKNKLQRKQLNTEISLHLQLSQKHL